MIREQAIAELKGCLKDYLETRGIDTRQNFRCLNPQHEDKNPSMGFDAANNQAHCFSCDAKYDIIDLIKLDYNCDFNEALKRGCDMYHIPLDGNISAGSSPIRKSAAELEREREAKREAEGEKRAAEQKKRSAELKAEFEAAKLATDEHPYLTEKQVKTDGTLRVTKDNALLIDAQDAEGNFKTYQRIFAKIPQNGERKKFAKGEGLKTAAFHVMAGEPLNDGEQIILAEGYATGASIYECISDRYRVIIAFDAPNLPKVTAAIKSKFPNIKIGIAADDDAAKHGDSKNPGVEAAKKSCKAGAAWYIKPPFDTVDFDNGRSDWNDYYCAYGADATREALLKALENPIQPLSVDTQIKAQGDIQTPNYSDEEIAQMYAEYAAQSNDIGDYDNLQTPSEAAVKEVAQKPSQLIIQKPWIVSAQYLMDNYQSTKWLIKKWIPENSQCMMFGASGKGKSFIALDMAASIACYDLPDWYGLKLKHGGVLYLCGEGNHGLIKRLIGWKQFKGFTNSNFDNLRITQFPKIINAEGAVEAIAETINKAKIENLKLIVVDTLNKHFTGNENDAGDAGGFFNALLTLQNIFNCSSLVVHHSGLAKEAVGRARGSSAIKGTLDMEFEVKSSGEGADFHIILEQSKNKDNAQEAPLIFRRVGIPLNIFDEDGEQEYTAGLELDMEFKDIEAGETKTEATEGKSYGIKAGAKRALTSYIKAAQVEGVFTDDGKTFYGVRREVWRIESFKLSKAETKEARKKEFNRGIADLIDLGILLNENDEDNPKGDIFRLDGDFDRYIKLANLGNTFAAITLTSRGEVI
ncbi:MAG: AAA family ATPase [Synergistaceae bacterium]|nr:AAA family ATPase [Synergistaceae bacterium]